MQQTSRRQFLAASLGSAGLGLCRPLSSLAWAPGQRAVLPVTAIVTQYRRNSHADVLVGKILEGFAQDGGAGPSLRLAGMYVDQAPASDMSRDLASRHGFRLFNTIEEAVTLGGDNVPVRGVLVVGEHGDYPYTPDTKQRMYPRRRFFDGVMKAFRRTGQVVPVFNDKHLAYRWEDAYHMYRTAGELKVPLMAGSSLPVAWRVPALDLPRDCQIDEAVACGYGGLESYGFHALETLQCMVERRRGGEVGVASIQAVQGDGIWQAEKEGRWSRSLLEAALKTTPNAKQGRLEDNLSKGAAFYLIEYRDGLKATVAMVSGHGREFAFAAKLKDRPQPLATWFRLQEERPFGHFAYLLRAIEQMIHTGKPAYPVERTLLTSGVLDAVMHSLAEDNRRMETPQLAIEYQSADWPFARS